MEYKSKNKSRSQQWLKSATERKDHSTTVPSHPQLKNASPHLTGNRHNSSVTECSAGDHTDIQGLDTSFQEAQSDNAVPSPQNPHFELKHNNH